MKYSVVFSSKTGNTAKLAEAIKEALPPEDCAYFGAPDVKAIDAPIIFVGFWTDKGHCDESAENFLKTISKKQVFLFGTAGFGGRTGYFDEILCTTKLALDSSNKIVGSFMCQGKMQISIREHYEKMLTGTEGDAKIKEMIKNFDSAASHPDKKDLDGLKVAIAGIVSKL